MSTCTSLVVIRWLSPKNRRPYTPLQPRFWPFGIVRALRVIASTSRSCQRPGQMAHAAHQKGLPAVVLSCQAIAKRDLVREPHDGARAIHPSHAGVHTTDNRLSRPLMSGALSVYARRRHRSVESTSPFRSSRLGLGAIALLSSTISRISPRLLL